MIPSPYRLDSGPNVVLPLYSRSSSYPLPPLHSSECPRSPHSFLLPLPFIPTSSAVLNPKEKIILTSTESETSDLISRPFREPNAVCTRAKTFHTLYYMTTSPPRSESQVYRRAKVVGLSFSSQRTSLVRIDAKADERCLSIPFPHPTLIAYP